jgi:aryl-alcohol dehydrogenase-like predicted oxidoreductase
MIDTAEAYEAGESEIHMCVQFCGIWRVEVASHIVPYSGKALKELGYRRSDLIVTTKLFWGTRTGPNDMGLSRKQYVKYA